EVAVVPDARKALEVGGVVARAVRVVPEADRHRGEGPGADQLALLAAQRPRLVVEDLDRHAQAALLDLPAPDRADGIAAGEAAQDVGAAGDRGEADVLLDPAVDVVEALGHQRRAGRGDGAQRRQRVRL